MGDKTNIAWTSSTWNPIRGCSRVSAGCENCYAESMAGRFCGEGMPYEGLIRKTAKGPRWNGNVRLVKERLGDPLRWTKPRRIFVNSMSDLFHEELSNEDIAVIFGVMAASPRHTFQVLTKRPERMREWFGWVDAISALNGDPLIETCLRCARYRMDNKKLRTTDPFSVEWPPNVWLGVSVEDQKSADERIPDLLRCPSAVRWVSIEPQLGVIDLAGVPDLGGKHLPLPYCIGYGHAEECDRESRGCFTGLDWVVVGGESGPRARVFNIEWARLLLRQCKEAGVPFFMKQLGSGTPLHTDIGRGRHVKNGDDYLIVRHRAGADPEEWPEDLRVREYPDTERTRSGS